jgi:O-antigen ligase
MPQIISKIINKNLWKIILAIFVIELFSLISFKLAWLSGIFFVLILTGVALFTLYNLKYGLYIALIELMIGSYGYLFYLQLPGFKMPIRLGIFLTLFVIWLIKYFNWRKYIQLLKKDRLVQNLAIFIIFLLIGIINGYLHGNGLKNIFFDVNGYLYFGLFFIFLEVFQSKKQVIEFLQIFIASLTYLTFKIFLTLYFFTHGFNWLTDLFYTWIRDTRVGEITWAGGSFYRIFIQSQIYSLIGVFITSLIIIKFYKKQPNFKLLLKNKKFQLFFGLFIIIQTSILISFSRSFWLGGFVGAIVLFVYLIILYKNQIKKLAKTIGILLLGAILSIILMITIVNFPIPEPGIFSADTLKNRFTTGDAAASSRWNLLPVLLEQNKKAPFFGTGFGTTVDYQTEDPRIKNEQNPQGWVTTFTFEWGYLDTITEIGILGLLVYLLLIIQIFWRGFIFILKYSKDTIIKQIHIGLLIGLIALLVTHAFSPYLNHPLGIGYLMLCAAIFSYIDKK